MNKIYSRLAFTNIKNNKTLYMPYIISGMVMIAMFYVMMFLNNSKGLGKVPGADALASIMGLGCGTIAVFSYIFLFYTNSFIIKRRKKEVGIYNILGMEKRHIARVLIIETLTVALAAIVSMKSTLFPDSVSDRARSSATVLLPSFGTELVTRSVRISSPQNCIFVFKARSDSFIV